MGVQIFFMTGFVMLFSTPVFAATQLYTNPVGSDVGLGNSFPISDILDTRIQFCIEAGHEAVDSYTSINSGGTTINFYNGSVWSTASHNQNDMLSEITCFSQSGCTDLNSSNYDETAIIDDGSCLFCNTQNPENCSETGCTSITYFWDVGVPECRPNQLGCKDPNAENYNSNATAGNNAVYCVYCAITSLDNCSNQTDCEAQGGQWVTGQCSGTGTPSSTIEGEVVIKPPNDPSYTVSQAVDQDYYSAVKQKCVSYNSSNLCDSWRWDLSGEFLDFLMSMVTKIVIGGVFLFVLIGAFYRLFLMLKTFFIGSPR